MVRELILAAAASVALSAAHAADLEGVSMPETRVVDGAQMRPNGIGLRTFSVLSIRIYVAGLYLERRNGDPDTILHSRERKLLDIRFLRDVDAEDARKAWQESFEQNCKPPCYLDYDVPSVDVWHELLRVLKPGEPRCNTLIDYFSTAALGHEKNRPTSPGLPSG